MILSKMHLQRIVVDIILLLAASFATITDMTPFVLVPTMRVKLIVSVKSFTAEATLWMSLETALVNRTWVIVSKLLMLSQLRMCEKFMLVSENLLVSSAEIATSVSL